MPVFIVLTTQWTPALVAAYYRAIITVVPLLCETYNRAEDYCVLAPRIFSQRNLCAHADKCQVALHLHVWNRMTESESEWRTSYKSFKNYSWIMAQLTFSFSPNQGISCSYSPIFFFLVTKWTTVSVSSHSYFPLLGNKTKSAWPFTRKKGFPQKVQNNQVLYVWCDFLASTSPLFVWADLIYHDDLVKDQFLD